MNNDGNYYPRITASHTGPNSSPAKVIDGNYWYHVHPPNRWTAEGSPHDSDWLTIDFGVKRKIHTVKLYLLDDGEKIVAPRAIDLEYWTGDGWKAVPGQVALAGKADRPSRERNPLSGDRNIEAPRDAASCRQGRRAD